MGFANANNKKQPYVTEVDLRHSLIPDELLDQLLTIMPEHKGPDLLEDREKQKYDYVGFMQRMMDGAEQKDVHGAHRVNGGSGIVRS